MFSILTSASAEQTINKSRFIAYVQTVTTEREIAAFFRAITTQHPTAHHLAYAYRIKTTDGLGNNMIVPRFSDAGEPSGTAGKPILQMLNGQDLINIVIAVIRYYGGINLGAGGLARAYGGTAKLALQACQIMPYVEMKTVKIAIEYNQLDYLTVFVRQKSGQIIDKQFDNKVHVQLSLPLTEIAALQLQFRQQF